jgi:hypothetical protein
MLLEGPDLCHCEGRLSCASSPHHVDQGERGARWHPGKEA